MNAWTGANVQQTWFNIHAVEVTLIRLSPVDTVAAKLRDIVADASLVLKPGGAHLTNLQQYADKPSLSDGDRAAIAYDVRAAYDACTDEQDRKGPQLPQHLAGRYLRADAVRRSPSESRAGTRRSGRPLRADDSGRAGHEDRALFERRFRAPP